MQVEVRDAATHHKLGLAYLRSGNKERARRHLQTAIDLKADDEEAKKLLESAQ
jgi:Flp pilus assembly protein TadD